MKVEYTKERLEL